MGGSAQWWVHDPKACSSASTYTICAVNVKTAVGHVRGGAWSMASALQTPPEARKAPQHRRREACTDSAIRILRQLAVGWLPSRYRRWLSSGLKWKLNGSGQ